MSNPNEVPPPEQPPAGNIPPAGGVPPAGSVPPAGGVPATANEPQGYQPPPPGYQAPGPAYPPPGQAFPPQNPPYAQGQPYGQAAYPAATAPSNNPPPGLGYAAPPRNAFGLDFNNIGQRLTDTRGVPQQLVVSYWLWIAAAALGIVFSLMMGGGVGGFIFELIFAALYVFIAIRLKEGARWARLVLSILGGLAVIGFLANLIFMNPSTVGSAAAVAAAIMMWLPQSREHFKG
jgi:hypothetical protein